MGMKTRRSPWFVLLWPASLLAVLLVIWVSGYVYWQIRISRAIADLRREPAKLSSRNPDLLDIGSRGFSRMIGELDGALAREDQVQAAAFLCGLEDLFAGAVGDDGRGVADRHRMLSMAAMRKECQSLQADWPQFRRLFAPWWMWWSGKRRSP